MEKEISLLISILSFLGMALIFVRKIPVLISLPEEKFESFSGKLFNKAKKIFLELKYFQKNFWEFFLEKNLQKIRILNLKIENKIFHWIKKRKEKEIEKKKDDFWNKIKEEIK